jgi:23S rRNA pseudouridine1911/1915/1917 synthase
MAVRHFNYRVRRPEAGQRLDLLAARWLPEALGRDLSKSTIRRLIVAGAIRVNGRPTLRPGMTLREEARITAAIDEDRLPAPAPEAWRTVDPQILFEDEVLIAVAKPAGLPTHATADAARADLYTVVRRMLAGRARSSGAAPTLSSASPGSTDAGVSLAALPYLGLHHRLDRDTSGVVLFTTSPDANAALAAQFERRSIEKVYHAITVRPAGDLPTSWQVRNRLALSGKGRAARMASVAEGGQEADTRFALLASWPSALLVEARPHTGRKHQVRAHLQDRGMPILGDARYGGPKRVGAVSIPRTMLHARRLVLQHPLDGRRLAIECDYPAEFRQVLDELRRAPR